MKKDREVKITDKKAYQKLIKARTSLVMEYPFFASLALRLKITEDSSCDTAWTDGRVFAYNPAYVNILSSEKLLGLSAHTVMHPACSHHKRRNNRDSRTWNQACDYVINPVLLEAGLTLPEGFLFDSAFKNKSADFVYEVLAEKDGDEEDDLGEKPDMDQGSDPSESKEKKEKESGSIVQDSSGGETADNKSENGDPGMSGEVRDNHDYSTSSGRDSDDLDEQEINWDQALIQAAANARTMGKLPRGIDRFVENHIHPTLPWQTLLSRFVREAARSDYSWITPNPRYIHLNIYLPALNNHQLSDIAVAVDTSGSIRPSELTQFGAELSGVLALLPARLHLMYADMTVTRYRVVEQWDLPFGGWF
ncbi:MAG: VWA-like domain-containing protein [Thermodesulfobacteriota bacterium]|nr:VWA-like domain-containing protein [Thermodesulfobacteriota bacterium]